MKDEEIVLAKLIHDLRNPLNSISMTAELSKLQIEQGEDPRAVVANLETILRICHQCGATLDRFARDRSSDGQSPRTRSADEQGDDPNPGT